MRCTGASRAIRSSWRWSRRCGIPAFRPTVPRPADRVSQDQRVTRYPTMEDVLGYCRYSANPVGRPGALPLRL